MDVMVLIDSFKGSMTSMEAGNAARDGVLRVYPHANVTVRPLADGGEGTTDALIEGLGGRKESGTVCDGTDGKPGKSLLRNPCG